jgi:hypothetical protein
MRNRVVSLLALAALPLFAVPALAQGANSRFSNYRGSDEPGPYIGFSVGQFNYKEDGLNDINPGVGLFRFGAYLSPNFAVEGRVGRSFGKTSVDGYGIEVQSLYAAYLKGVVPVTRGFALYGLGGVAGAQLHRDYTNYHSTDSGVSYGLGAEINFPNRMILSAEFLRLLTGSNVGYDFTVNQATVGLAWRF